MNQQSRDRFESDDELLARLTQAAHQIEPDPSFQAQLEAALQQAHPSTRNHHRGQNPMSLVWNKFARRPVVVVGTAVAIVVTCLIPVATNQHLPEWMSVATGEQANAQTLAQVMAERRITLTADAMAEDPSTGNVNAKGHAAFEYPDAEIKATADEILFVKEQQEFVLTGNVNLVQKGETLQGQKVTCRIIQKQCSLTTAASVPVEIPDQTWQVHGQGAILRPQTYTLAQGSTGVIKRTSNLKSVQI